MLIKRIMIAFASIALVVASVGLLEFSPAVAATITTPANASVSSDSATGSSVSLPAIVVTEAAAGDIPAGVLTWSLPSGYVFDTFAVADVKYTGTGLAGSAAIVAFTGTTKFSVTVTSVSTVAGSLTIGSVTPLKVKASAGTSMAAAGNIMLTSGSINGVSGSASFGLLTQVPGAANKLAFTTQPPATAAAGAMFNATIGVQDQFGNMVNTDSGRNITLAATLASGTTGILNGTLTKADTSGAATFSDLSFSGTGQIQLNAASSDLTGALSSAVALSTTVPPSTSCNLQNGILVKVAGSPTVYLVVNCVLRPFNSEAIFHAKGEKFSDIRDIAAALFAGLNKGKDIGDGNDDDSTVVTPASTATTPPTVSGLPDGAVVKIPDNPTVYIVTGGELQPFTSLAVFKAHKKSFSDVQIISAAQFASMTVGAPATFPDGTLLKGSDDTVFVVEGGQLFGIPSMNVLNKHGWSLSSLLKVDNSDLKEVSRGGNED